MSWDVGRNTPSESREQYVWLGRFGYRRVQSLVRGGTLAYVFLTALVTILTSDLLTLLFLGLLAVIVLQFASTDRYLSPRRRVNIYTEEGLYIAEHAGTGTIRHGKTPEDALSNLDETFGRAA